MLHQYTYPILYGLFIGVFTRLILLRTDYRQYPSHPHGKLVHLALGIIAAALGTFAIPSVMHKDFTAITFLTLAASQFRDVRNMERTTLQNLDQLELVKRGPTYIEGIAIAFEGRNYLVIFTSLFATFAYIAVNLYAAIALSVAMMFIAKRYMSGSRLKKIADVKEATLHFKGEGLYVDNIYIMNIGLKKQQEEIITHGMAFVIIPKTFDAQTTLANLGQRQAILYDLSVTLGIYRDSGTPSLTPLIKRDLNSGAIGVFILPQIRDTKLAKMIIEQVPTLENAIRLPMKSLQMNRRDH